MIMNECKEINDFKEVKGNKNQMLNEINLEQKEEDSRFFLRNVNEISLMDLRKVKEECRNDRDDTMSVSESINRKLNSRDENHTEILREALIEINNINNEMSEEI